MPTHNSYYRGALAAWLFRCWVYAWVLAIMALTFAGCSVPKPTDILPSMSVPTDFSGRREGTQTRNDEPQSGGCHEKSDSSLRKPLT